MSSKPSNKRNFDFVKHSKIYFMISSVIAVLGILSLLLFGLKLGVDFKSGTNLDIAVTNHEVTKDEVEHLVKEAGFSDFSPSIGETRVSIRFEEVLNDTQTATIIEAFENQYGEDHISVEENTVDGSMARELAQKAILVVFIASLIIIVYVTIRFEWRFAIAAVVALFHDAFFVITVFSIFRLEVNLTFIAAVLTIIGYSINDTIVIFDRIRENLRKSKVKTYDDLASLVNLSINQTLARSINTALTVVFAAALLLLMGSSSIQLFSLAMLIGLISGGYSSIFIASQLWLVLKKNSLNKKTTAVTTS